MANQPIHNPNDFLADLYKLLTTDDVHADVMNPILERLINNDVFLKAIAEQAAPAGTVAFFPYSTPPSGWIKTNGAELTRTVYSNLFSKIKTRYNKQFTVNLTTDEITCTSHGFSTGDAVDVAAWLVDGTAGVLPGGLQPETTYYGRKISNDVITIHPTQADAVANTNKINITALNGASFCTIAAIDKFAILDLRGEFLRVWDDGRGVDSGRALGSAQIGSFLPGDNNASDEIIYVHNATDKSGLGWDDFTGTPASGTVKYTSVTTSYNNPSNISQHSGAARPRNVALLACIKY